MPSERKPLLAATVSLFALNFLGPAALVLPVPFCIWYRSITKRARFAIFLLVLAALVLIPQAPLSLFLAVLHYTALLTGFLGFLFWTELGRPGTESVLLGMLITVFTGLSMMLAYPLLMGNPLATDILGYLTKSGIPVSEQFQKAMEQSAGILPGFIAASEGLALLLNLYLFRRITGIPVGFRHFSLPFHFVPVFVGAATIYILTGIYPVLQVPELLNQSLVNILIAITFFYFLQGLAVLLFFLERFKLSPIFKWLMIALAFVQPGPFLVILTGFADTWLEIRKRSSIIR